MRRIDRQIHAGRPWCWLPWLWHALLDGTPLCRCAHSHWVHGDGPGPREIYGPDGAVTGIAWDGPSMCECVPGYASGRRSG
jgi:hypothetical protein